MSGPSGSVDTDERRAGSECPVQAAPISDVVARFGTDLAVGLGSAEAARRLASVGPNELAAAPPVPAWRKLLGQFVDPLVVLLLAAIVVSVAAWLIEGTDGVPFEALVIAVIVALNGVLGFLQEAKAEAAVAALQRLTVAESTVLRDGERRRVAARELVPGDLLLLTEGDAVNADARLVEASALRVAEAALTGESEAVLKDIRPVGQAVALGDRADMVFSCTAVTSGRARAVVTATGMRTELGRIAALLQAAPVEPTPLQREIGFVGRLLGGAVVVIAVLVVGALVLTSDIDSTAELVDVLLIGVALAVAAVPEGLPAILSVVLALGMQRLARHRAIVKKLSSVETLGSTSVICCDKTGTLTTGEMTVRRVLTPSADVELTGIGFSSEGDALQDGRPVTDAVLVQELRGLFTAAHLASDATVHDDDGTLAVHGDPTEAALLVAGRKTGVRTDDLEGRFARVGEVPFTAERKLMSTVQHDRLDDRFVIVTKGAPEVVVTRCAFERAGGRARPLTPHRRDEILSAVEQLADGALRTLAVAYRPLPLGLEVEPGETLERDLVYLGTVGIMDPPRAEAKAAVAEAQRAGIRVVMITGDHPRTAVRIADELGISPPGGSTVTGRELETVSDEELQAAVRSAAVYARVAPEQKLRIVDALQADGRVVAMTGDGVNDAPALKSADIGIAMGTTGTDVAKEAAKIILTDDNFATIVGAVREGRAILSNIRKFLRYLLSSNVGEVLTMFVGIVLAGLIGLKVGDGETFATPLLATQILWINLLTDALPALALGVDPPPADLMVRPPRRLGERVINAAMGRSIATVGVAMAAATLLTLDLKLPGGLIEGSSSLAEARTAAFTVLVLAQLFNCFNSRSDRTSAFQCLFTNPLLWGAVAISAALQVLVVHVGFLNDAFGTTPLQGVDWLLCIAMASTVLWVDEVRKLMAQPRG